MIAVVRAEPRRWMPHLLLFVTVLIWSGNTVISKLVMFEVPSTQLALVRFSLGVVAFHLPLFIFLIRRGETLSRSEFLRLLLIGAAGAGTSVMLYTMGLGYTPATLTSLITMTGPPITALLAWVFFREALGWMRALGTAIAFAGAAVLVTGGELADPEADLLTGTALLIACQVAWAIYILFGKPLVAHRTPLLVLSGSHLFALASVWPMALPLGGWDFVWELTNWSSAVWGGVFYLAFANTALSQVLFLYALREVSSSQAVSYTYLQPPVTALMAMATLGEQPGPLTLACGVVIVFGLWLVNRPRPTRRRPNLVDATAAPTVRRT